jgi:hypothetical protein
MKKTPLPKHGCFTVKYPSTEWLEQSCTKAPNIPVIPKQGSAPQTVGNGNDFVAEVTSGFISSAEGSFPNSSGVTSESGYVGGVAPSYSNAFTLQLNSNYFARVLKRMQAYRIGCFKPVNIIINDWEFHLLSLETLGESE